MVLIPRNVILDFLRGSQGFFPFSFNFLCLLQLSQGHRLKLRTLVSLTPQTPSNELLKFCERENVRVLYFPASKFKGDVTLPSYLVAEILEVRIFFLFPKFFFLASHSRNTHSLSLFICSFSLSHFSFSKWHCLSQIQLTLLLGPD